MAIKTEVLERALWAYIDHQEKMVLHFREKMKKDISSVERYTLGGFVERYQRNCAAATFISAAPDVDVLAGFINQFMEETTD